jgi:hypothetical protein
MCQFADSEPIRLREELEYLSTTERAWRRCADFLERYARLRVVKGPPRGMKSVEWYLKRRGQFDAKAWESLDHDPDQVRAVLRVVQDACAYSFDFFIPSDPLTMILESSGFDFASESLRLLLQQRFKTNWSPSKYAALLSSHPDMGHFVAAVLESRISERGRSFGSGGDRVSG